MRKNVPYPFLETVNFPHLSGLPRSRLRDPTDSNRLPSGPIDSTFVLPIRTGIPLIIIKMLSPVFTRSPFPAGGMDDAPSGMKTVLPFSVLYLPLARIPETGSAMREAGLPLAISLFRAIEFARRAASDAALASSVQPTFARRRCASSCTRFSNLTRRSPSVLRLRPETFLVTSSFATDSPPYETFAPARSVFPVAASYHWPFCHTAPFFFDGTALATQSPFSL